MVDVAGGAVVLVLVVVRDTGGGVMVLVVVVVRDTGGVEVDTDVEMDVLFEGGIVVELDTEVDVVMVPAPSW